MTSPTSTHEPSLYEQLKPHIHTLKFTEEQISRIKEEFLIDVEHIKQSKLSEKDALIEAQNIANILLKVVEESTGRNKSPSIVRDQIANQIVNNIYKFITDELHIYLMKQIDNYQQYSMNNSRKKKSKYSQSRIKIFKSPNENINSEIIELVAVSLHHTSTSHLSKVFETLVDAVGGVGEYDVDMNIWDDVPATIGEVFKTHLAKYYTKN